MKQIHTQIFKSNWKLIRSLVISIITTYSIRVERRLLNWNFIDSLNSALASDCVSDSDCHQSTRLRINILYALNSACTNKTVNKNVSISC